MSPSDSEDLTIQVRRNSISRQFEVQVSPPTAEHHPDYVTVCVFATRDEADAYTQAYFHAETEPE
ncbi:MAG: hypothetical protein U1E56_10120 [Bauldia sp.]